MGLDIWEQIEKETKTNRKNKEAFINEINPTVLKMLEVFNGTKYEKVIKEKDLADLFKLIKKVDQEQKLNTYKNEHGSYNGITDKLFDIIY